MEIGQIGEIGALVIVITVLEQEQGTEIDLVLTQHHYVMESKIKDFPGLLFQPEGGIGTVVVKSAGTRIYRDREFSRDCIIFDYI